MSAPHMESAPLSEDVRARLRLFVERALRKGIIKDDPEEIARAIGSTTRAREQLARLQPWLQPDQRTRLLEVGSGFGIFLSQALNQPDIDAYGVEPDVEEASIASDVLYELAAGRVPVVRGVGEELPFPSHSVDLVCSFNVFEHVADPDRVLAECIRVLKPGGYLYFNFPSYGSWWEGHYGIIWFPGMPKWLAKIYVALLGGDPHFIDTLQFITHRRLVRMLRPLHDRVEIMLPDFGQSLWEERVRSMDFSAWGMMGRLKGWVQLLHRLHLVDVLIFLGRRLHWETPFVLVLRKK